MSNFELGALIGSLGAGFLFTAIFSALIEFVGFRNLDPMPRAILTVASGYLVAAVLRSFIASQAGNEQWVYFLLYLPGAVLVFLWYLRRYRKAWTTGEADGE